MEIKEWRSLAIQSVSLFLAVFICCICFAGHIQKQPETIVMAEKKTKQKVQDEENDEGQEEIVQPTGNVTKSQVESRSDTYIRIPKAEIAEVSKVYIRNDYINSKIQMTFQSIKTGSVTKNSILRVQGFKVNKGKVTKKKEDSLLQKLVINDQKNSDAEKNVIRVEMVTRKLYEPVLFEAEDAYYISLLEPYKAFDKIVVIDAGHGGMDEGTSSMDGRHVEKDYTLLIVKRIRKILEKENVKVYYTRMADKEVSKRDRTRLANRLQADVFVSIHCNASSVGDSTAYGMETLYSKRKFAQKKLTSKRLAQIILDQMGEETGLRKRGIIQREQLYLLHHANVPTTIVEIGYMSNKDDLKYIKKESGQQEIAQGICNGIMRALEEE